MITGPFSLTPSLLLLLQLDNEFRVQTSTLISLELVESLPLYANKYLCSSHHKAMPRCTLDMQPNIVLRSLSALQDDPSPSSHKEAARPETAEAAANMSEEKGAERRLIA